MKTRKKQRIVILTLGAVILGLVLGYAALSQVLNINGTSSISGDFNIQIIALDENTMNHAQTVSKSGLGTTTVSFTVDLESPGASAIYDVTVENKGSIDAVLKSIEGIDEANLSAPLDVKFSTTGIEEGDPLLKGQRKTFQVQVRWDSSATEIPTSNKTLVLKLNYEQQTVELPTISQITYDKIEEYTMPEPYPTTYVEGTTTTLPTPTKSGYTFGGWFLQSDFSGLALTEIGTDMVGDVTLYPKWEANEPQTPQVTTYNYNIDGEEWTSAISPMGVTATVTDGGTLSYSWDLYKFALIDQGGKSVPGARKVFSTFTGSEITAEMINEVMYAPWSRSSWMQGSSVDPFMYGSPASSGIAGYVTVTNTLNGKTKSVTVWVGTEGSYKRMYEEAPKGTPIS